MPETHDVLILGRGIAGAVLAEACSRRGLSVHVFDRKRAGNASMAAAGVVNPVVLRRDVPSWRAMELMPLAVSFYGNWQARLGVQCWHPLPLMKIFPSQGEVAQWERAMTAPATSAFIGLFPDPDMDTAPIHAPYGYGVVTAAAWLDVPKLLDAQREELLRNGRLTEAEIAEADIRRTTDGVCIGEVQGRWLVRCMGPYATLPGLIPVKGETLTVRIPGLRLNRMVHRGIFLLPLGEELYRLGATFKWNEVWEGSTAEAREWLMTRLRALVDLPVEVVGQNVGVRPTTKDRRPLIGMVADHEVVLNGLGSRGVMLAPWCAEHLLAHLCEGTPLDDEVRCDRF